MNGRGEVIRGRDATQGLVLDCDVVVIGSGAGGATVALRAVEAGRSVVIVEEGPYITAAEHGAMRPSESLRHVWRDGGLSFAVGVGDSPMINVTMGRVVGGSSMVTGGVCLRPPEDVLARWAGERGLADLGPGRLDPWLETVERLIHVEPVPASRRSRGTQRFGEGLRKLHGAELVRLQRNTIDCNGCGSCNFGCPHEAKMSVDKALLPRAVALGAIIVADASVDRISFDGARAVGCKGRLGDASGKVDGRPTFQVKAREVVLAAGAWHNPDILRRSLKPWQWAGLPQLGRHLTLHPSFRMLARFDERIEGWNGALQSAYADRFMSEGLTLVSLFVPPGVLAATMPGFGPELMRRARDIPHLAMFGGLVHDEGGGTIWPAPGRDPFVTYRMDRRDRAKIPVLLKRMAEIFFAAGARECFLPVLGLDPVTPDSLRTLDLERLPGRRFESASQHPLGTCRMGRSRREGVVDGDGRPFGLEGLVIADGSIVPTSLGVNPQVTVMAMALRVADRMLDGGTRTVARKSA
jgi:choline dehydrogenase-like flavoprotein